MKLTKKLGMAFLTTILAVGLLTACGGSDESSGTASKNDNSANSVSTEASVDMKELEASMVGADDTIPTMSVVYGSDDNGPDLFSYLADYDYENVEDYFFAYAAAGTAEEVAVVRLKSESAAKDCLAAVKKHVESRVIQFKTYDPSQVERCEAAVTFSNENYVVLIISDNSDKVKEEFYNAFKN